MAAQFLLVYAQERLEDRNSTSVARHGPGMGADKHRQDEREEKGSRGACRTVVNERLRAPRVILSPFRATPSSFRLRLRGLATVR